MRQDKPDVRHHHLLKLVLATVRNWCSDLGVARFAQVQRNEVFVLESPRTGDGVPSRPGDRRRWLPSSVGCHGMRSPGGRQRRVEHGRSRRRFELSRLHQISRLDVHDATATTNFGASDDDVTVALWRHRRAMTHTNVAVQFYRVARQRPRRRWLHKFFPLIADDEAAAGSDTPSSWRSRKTSAAALGVGPKWRIGRRKAT